MVVPPGVGAPLEVVEAQGVLELAVPPSELEKIASQYGEQLPEGFAVDISIPPLGNQHFKGVKSFKSLVDEEGNYLSAPSSNMAEKTAVAKEQVISGRLGELSVGYTMDEIVANAPSKPTPSLYQCVKDYVNRFF